MYFFWPIKESSNYEIIEMYEIGLFNESTKKIERRCPYSEQ